MSEIFMGRKVARNSPAKMTKTKMLVKNAFDEVMSKTPKNVIKTGKTGVAKHKMEVAIALSKARAKGANIPYV